MCLHQNSSSSSSSSRLAMQGYSTLWGSFVSSLSILFLNSLTLVVSTTSFGRVFHEFATLFVKKLCRWLLFTISRLSCLRRPALAMLVLGWLTQLTTSRPLVILNIWIKSPRVRRFVSSTIPIRLHRSWYLMSLRQWGIFVARRWTFSITLMSPLEWGHHAWTANSRWGLT